MNIDSLPPFSLPFSNLLMASKEKRRERESGTAGARAHGGGSGGLLRPSVPRSDACATAPARGLLPDLRSVLAGAFCGVHRWPGEVDCARGDKASARVD